ncbi:MAG: hypothetical protein MI741_02680, partial [Rhodospirillales bacterium]|nr:hypothetical protein [Rhodospirillales bacterium]
DRKQFEQPPEETSRLASAGDALREPADLAVPIPSSRWRMLAEQSRPLRPMPKDLDALWESAGAQLTLLLPRYMRCRRRAARVLRLEKGYADMADAALREAALNLRAIFRRGREKPADVFHGFAVVRETARRVLGMQAYPVQVAAATALFDGCIAEVATGEGKTLLATLPATLFGWRGRGCHVVTVNDYLAKRDAEWMSDVYRACGLTVSHVEGEMDPAARRVAYAADITYLTNKEVCADFLRDRLVLGRQRNLTSSLLAKMVSGGAAGHDRLVMRGLACAIIDETDSVLIDESVTPLIISGDAPNAEQVDVYGQAAQIATQLEIDKDFKLNQRHREADLTSRGKRHIAKLTEQFGGLWTGARRREEFVLQALSARYFFIRDQQYVVEDGKVVIVDEFTGRLMRDRTWRDGLHQAVEAKEQLEVQPPKTTYARISFQRFFRQYRKLCGMTGTAYESRHELWRIYRTPLVRVPTHRKCKRRLRADRVFATQEAKYKAAVQEVEAMHKKGRAVLVGTTSVEESEKLSGMLNKRALEHDVLNAVRHAEEAAIVAEAGKAGRITVATNMAGRGTDIKLDKTVRNHGGLHVIATNRHASGRVDRQLFGRAGRQGDPGSAAVFVSLQDELIKRYAPKWAVRLLRVASFGKPERYSMLARP